MPSIRTASFLSFNTDAKLILALDFFDGDPRREKFGRRLHELMKQSVGLPLEDDWEGSWPGFGPEQWVGHVDAVVDACGKLMDEFEN